MSNARKLQTEIDRVMKKVDEGVEIFDDIWEKVYSTEQQNQKEKYEMDLKKEIKKLQRQRDQIKTWIGSSDVKDKDALIEARKLIETKMEQFKVCEKETKTKTYSKEGLAREERLDPAEESKLATTTWLGEYIEKMMELVEEAEFEIEKLSAGKGKKTNKHQIDDLQQRMANHKFHVSKMEGIIRLVNNDLLDVDPVDQLQEDMDYYLDSYKDEDYIQAYDEEYFYESLGLDELDVVNVDRVTQTSVSTKKSSDDMASTSSKGSRDRKSGKKSALSSVIPLTIGRARSTKDKERDRKKEEEEKASTPTKITRSTSATSSKSVDGPVPAAKVAPTASLPGASMAAILKRETEQQEKERQKLLREQQARIQAEQLRQQQARQQQEAQLRQEAMRQQQAQQQEVLKRQQEEVLRQQQAQKEVVAKQQAQQAAQLQAQQQAALEKVQQNQQTQQSGHGINSLDMLTTGLGGLGLGGPGDTRGNDASSSASMVGSSQGNKQFAAMEGGSSYLLSGLEQSFTTAPNAGDTDRTRPYTPQNPYPSPSSYPSTPSAIFENPGVFEKLGTDCLFFIFYYAQGTYQQYLAARELKKQSWRFHKKYMTWFQRHEEPKITTDEYEQGTYVYFDYETGWCTRIKTDFRFEYSFLEDTLQ